MNWPRTIIASRPDGAVELVIRPFAEEKDSVEELTEFLHRAYRVLADMGLRFLATHQTPEQTRNRIGEGVCLVATIDGRIAGTIIYVAPGRGHGASWYARPEVAFFAQFGVEPELRRYGVGSVLLELVEEMARHDGAGELALDTAETAHHLIAWYGKRGYRLVDHVQWDVTNYRSVILSKALNDAVAPARDLFGEKEGA